MLYGMRLKILMHLTLTEKKGAITRWPEDITFAGISNIEVQTRPSVPDNIKSWQVFNDDDDILRFLTCIEQDEGLEIDFGAFV